MNAVTGALELQRKMAEANEPLPEAQRIVFRIGINLGNVIGEGEDIYGEGVNIAARLDALAKPGGICISAKIYDEVRGKLDCAFEDMGEQTVKNISRPVRAYRLRPEPTTDVGASAPADLSLPDKPSIAVLPFQNMSGDAEQDYFADGNRISSWPSAWQPQPAQKQESSPRHRKPSPACASSIRRCGCPT